MELRCDHKTYEWGQLGTAGAVGRLLASAQSLHCVQCVSQETPYAELWMGTHTAGPSYLIGDHQTLSEYIEMNPQCLGDATANRFGRKHLPFLFKVLSVRKALSIQAHPDSHLASRLNAQSPDIYRDPRHKPEMTIALTEFHALCGFRPLAQILHFIRTIPEFAAVLQTNDVNSLESPENEEDSKRYVFRLFSSLMNTNHDTIRRYLNELAFRLDNSTDTGPEMRWFVELSKQFPDDVGCFCVFLLNLIELKPGEAMFLAANVPHSYLQGDCVECMACSDNVVRAGLTPKYKDVDTLINMLDYTSRTRRELILDASESTLVTMNYSSGPMVLKEDPQAGLCVVYSPPVDEFAVARISVSSACAGTFTLPPRSSASILVCVEGDGFADDGLKIHSGSVLFLHTNRVLRISIAQNVRMLLFQAFCPLSY